MTHATADGVAEWGQKTWLGSQHSRDPRDVTGVRIFGSDGNWVPGFGSVEGEYGEPTEGHNARESVSEEIVRWTTGLDGTPYPELEQKRKTGYFDPSAESFKHLVTGLREAYTTEGSTG